MSIDMPRSSVPLGVVSGARAAGMRPRHPSQSLPET